MAGPSDAPENIEVQDVPSLDSPVEALERLDPSPIPKRVRDMGLQGSSSHEWVETTLSLTRRAGITYSGIELPLQTRVVIGSRSRQPSGFDVSPGFSPPIHRLLSALAPEIYQRIVKWPELRGVRLALRIYRFVSTEERDLELVRVELRIPGIGVDERFSILRTLRTELEAFLDQAEDETEHPGDRRLYRALRESFSVVIAG